MTTPDVTPHVPEVTALRRRPAINARAVRVQLAECRGHTDPQAMHYWEAAAAVALEWFRAGNKPAMSAERLHVRTLAVLEAQAYHEQQSRTRSMLWHTASQVAVLAGAMSADRDAVMAVLHVWAVSENEDRWAATLPACDRECGSDREPWSQIGHLRDCARGRAWRAHFRPGWRS